MIHRTIQEPIHKTHVLPAIFKREYLPPKVADSNEVKKAIDEAFRNALSPTTNSTTETFVNESSEQTMPQEVQDYSLQTEPEIEQTTSTNQIFQSQMIIPQTQSFIVPIQNQSQILIPTPISQPQITQSVPLVNMVVPQSTQIIQPVPQPTQIMQSQIIQPVPQTTQVMQSQIIQPVPQTTQIIQPVVQPTQVIQSNPQPTQIIQPVPQPTQIIQPVVQPTQIIQPIPQPTQIIQPIPQPTQIIQSVPQQSLIIQPIPQATPLLGQTIIMPIGPMAFTTQPLLANTYQASTY